MTFSKILVIKLRAIGDVVLSTPVLANLNAAFPEADIHFLTESASAPAVEGHPHADRVLVLPDRKAHVSAWRYHTAMIRFLSRIRKQRYDLVLDLFGNPRSALITRLSGAPVRAGYRFRGRMLAYNRRIEPHGDRVHEVRFNLDALRALGVPVRHEDPRFVFGPEDARRIDTWIAGHFSDADFLIAVHPWGSWPAKRWPLTRFSQLADRLVRALDARVIVLWGPGEKAYAEEVLSASNQKLALAPQTTLKELGALLARCGLVVANDSGPMHIAAAVGAPTVGLFGPTNPALQGPFGPNGLAVFNPDVSCIGCNRLRCPDGSCMTGLTVDHVEAEILEFLKKNHSRSSNARKKAYQKTGAS